MNPRTHYRDGVERSLPAERVKQWQEAGRQLADNLALADDAYTRAAIITTRRLEERYTAYYVHDGEAICKACITDDQLAEIDGPASEAYKQTVYVWSPVGRSEEHETRPTCDRCLQAIEDAYVSTMLAAHAVQNPLDLIDVLAELENDDVYNILIDAVDNNPATYEYIRAQLIAGNYPC